MRDSFSESGYTPDNSVCPLEQSPYAEMHGIRVTETSVVGSSDLDDNWPETDLSGGSYREYGDDHNLAVPEHRTATRAMQGQLWRRFKAEHDALRDATEVITGEVVKNMEGGDAATVATETADLPVARNLPTSSVDTVCLPPHIFGCLDDPNWEPRIPRDWGERQELMRAYRENGDRGWLMANLPPSDSPNKSGYNPFDSRGANFARCLESIGQQGITLDKQTWENYRQTALELERGGDHQLSRIADYRAGTYLEQPEPFRALDSSPYVVSAESSLGAMHIPPTRHPSMNWKREITPADCFTLPVGEYGSDWTEKLIRTGIYAKEQVAAAACQETVKDVAATQEKTIRTHAARARLSPQEIPTNEKLGLTMEEGCLTTIQTLSLLTNSRIEGYPTPEALTQAIIGAGLVEEFTKAVPAGVVGPLTVLGRVIPELVQKNEQGELQLNPEIMEKVKAAKNIQIATVADDWEHGRGSQIFGLICPAAMPHGALTDLTRAFGKYLTE